MVFSIDPGTTRRASRQRSSIESRTMSRPSLWASGWIRERLLLRCWIRTESRSYRKRCAPGLDAELLAYAAGAETLPLREGISRGPVVKLESAFDRPPTGCLR